MAQQKRFFHGLTIPEIVKCYYPTYSSHEISKMFGASSGSICKYARKMGVVHTEETELRLRKKNFSGDSPVRKSAASIAKLKRTIKRKIRQDRERILCGKKPLYRQALSIAPRKLRLLMWRLAKERGYFCDCRVNSFALFYDEHTVRESPRYRCDENYYREKYGLLFLPAHDDKEGILNDK